MERKIVKSDNFRIKMKYFCNVFFGITVKESYYNEKEENENEKLREEIASYIYNLKYQFARTRKIMHGKENLNKEEEEQYVKTVQDKKNVFAWIYKDGSFPVKRFVDSFESTNFFNSYSVYFPSDFDVNSFIDDSYSTVDFTSNLVTIKSRSNNTSLESTRYKDFKYITFYSITNSELIYYEIKYINSKKIKLTSQKKGSRDYSKEEYTGDVDLSNGMFTINASNEKINVKLVFLLSISNSFSNQAIVGITLGVSTKDTISSLLAKKVMLSKESPDEDTRDITEKLQLFLNEQQSLRIHDKDINNLNSIVETGKTKVSYLSIIDDIQYQMSEGKKIINNKKYINTIENDIFFMPLIENFNTLESNFNRINELSLEYKISMNMIDVFESMSSNTETFNLLKNDQFRITMCFDLTKYKHNIFFNNKSYLKEKFKYIADLVKSKQIEIFFIVEDIKKLECQLQLRFMPNDLLSITSVVSKKKVRAKYEIDYYPLNDINTVFILIGKKIVLKKANTHEFIYTSVDKGKQAIKSALSSIDTLKECSDKYNDSLIK